MSYIDPLAWGAVLDALRYHPARPAEDVIGFLVRRWKFTREEAIAAGR